ncbi:MAG: hypothetical protein LBF33_01985 [Oscillospiraceae bacterium]|nr:hypothetical protein [Oscillospiraceae bacterium]
MKKVFVFVILVSTTASLFGVSAMLGHFFLKNEEEVAEETVTKTPTKQDKNVEHGKIDESSVNPSDKKDVVGHKNDDKQKVDSYDSQSMVGEDDPSSFYSEDEQNLKNDPEISETVKDVLKRNENVSTKRTDCIELHEVKKPVVELRKPEEPIVEHKPIVEKSGSNILSEEKNGEQLLSVSLTPEPEKEVINNDKMESEKEEIGQQLQQEQVKKSTLNEPKVTKVGTTSETPKSVDAASSSSNSSRIESTSMPFYHYLGDKLENYRLEKPMRGVDISCWNTPGDQPANLSKAKEDGYEFVIVRATFGKKDGDTELDSYFFKHAEEAKKAGVDLGLYHYGRFKTKEQAVGQARRICTLADEIEEKLGIKVVFPIYLDLENFPGKNNFSRLHERKKLVELVLAFCDTVTEFGRVPGLYCSVRNYKDWFLESKEVVDKSCPISGIPRWIAWYPSPEQKETIEPPFASIWQYTNEASVIGCGADGKCDANLCYYDFPKYIGDLGLKKTTKKYNVDLKNPEGRSWA